MCLALALQLFKLFYLFPDSNCSPINAAFLQVLCKKALILHHKQKKCHLTGYLRFLVDNHTEPITFGLGLPFSHT